MRVNAERADSSVFWSLSIVGAMLILDRPSSVLAAAIATKEPGAFPTDCPPPFDDSMTRFATSLFASLTSTGPPRRCRFALFHHR